MAKFIISDYELMCAAFMGLRMEGKLPELPKGQKYAWTFSRDEKGVTSLTFESHKEEEKKVELKKPYEAGDWR